MDRNSRHVGIIGSGNLIKPILILTTFVIIVLLFQVFLSTTLAQASSSNLINRLAQIVTDTPTATATSTSTATPTLAPVSLSFQNGVFPSAAYAGMEDTYISQTDSFGNYGFSPTLKVNGAVATDANYVLLKWDISQIPPGSEILSASLVFNVITPTVDSYPIYQLLKPWVFNQANWINYAGGTPWEAPGAAGQTDRGTQVLTSFAPNASGIYQLNLNRVVVQTWADNPSQNNGLIIADSTSTSQAIFESAQATTPSNRPKLVIQFNLPPGTTPTPTFTSTPTQPAPAPPTNLVATAVTTTQINLVWTDNSTDETGFQIERSTDNINWTLIGTIGANITNYSDTGLTPSTNYFYRVRAVSSTGASAYSNVASASTNPTATPTTPTPTVSGTPPTPTITGTIIPNFVIDKTVSPSQASVGQLFNFSIQITNNGTAPASNAFLTDSFPSVLTVTGAQTNKGTYTINTASNTITFTIGNINPNETVRVGVLAQVNNTAVANTNYTNSATLSFRIDTVNQSRTSNSVSYRIIGTSTLPGTGLAQIDDNEGNATFRTIALSITVLLAFLGLVVLIVGLRARKQQSAWSTWLTRMALIMIGAALVFGLATWGLSLPSQSVVDSSPLVSSSTPVIVSWHADPENLSFEMLLPTPTPDTLPDYQVPTPDTDSQNSESADTSPIQQLMVPALGLDAVVKYVPYDGYTWQIAGLKQEIAWLGETSWPGLGKNTGLAGHVTLVDGTDGPFRYLADLRTGDVVTVYTEENIYSYTVREQAVVSDSELSVLEPTDESQLTLITCTNWNKDLKLYLDRLVVFADLDKVEPIQQANLGN